MHQESKPLIHLVRQTLLMNKPDKTLLLSVINKTEEPAYLMSSHITVKCEMLPDNCIFVLNPFFPTWKNCTFKVKYLKHPEIENFAGIKWK